MTHRTSKGFPAAVQREGHPRARETTGRSSTWEAKKRRCARSSHSSGRFPPESEAGELFSDRLLDEERVERGEGGERHLGRRRGLGLFAWRLGDRHSARGGPEAGGGTALMEPCDVLGREYVHAADLARGELDLRQML